MNIVPFARMRLFLLFVLFEISVTPHGNAQYAATPRAAGMGAFTALSAGIGGLDWNAAGLAGIGPWKISTAGMLSWSRGWNSPLVAVSVGRSIDNVQSFAARYSPGLQIEFSIPSTITVQDSLSSFRTTFDKRLTYSETFAFGYAVRVRDNLSFGLALHSFDERINDTRYALDTSGAITSSTLESVATTLTFDFGIAWKPSDEIRFGFAGRNFGRIMETRLPSDLGSYALQKKPLYRIGAAWTAWKPVTLTADLDNERRFRTGAEWNVNEALAVRGGVFIDKDSPTAIDALALGAGYTYGRFAVNGVYLKFTGNGARTGSAALSLLDQLSVTNLEYNAFSNDRLAFSATATIGRTGSPDLVIEYADMTSEIYPSARDLYAVHSVGRARVRNTASAPRQARVSFQIDDVMDRPTETAPVTLQPGEVKELPFYAVFNGRFRLQKTLAIREAVIAASSTATDDPDDRYQLRVLLRGRNDWNGDAEMLRYFVTPQDSAVVSWSRAALRDAKSRLDTIAAELANVERARALFDHMASDMQYVRDPKLSQDNVQYPSETLALRGGDCDDMTVTFATLLTGVGIPVAFVDVVPPKEPENSHIYLMFDTGIDASRSALLTANPKRFIVRPNEQGKETVWIPVETTVTSSRFDAAWNAGADEYYNDAVLRFGAARGWVKIVDLVLPQ